MMHLYSPLTLVPSSSSTTEVQARAPKIAEPVYTEVDVPHWIEIASELPLQRQPEPERAQSQAGTARHHVVVLASGPEDGGRRATLAFAAACTALSLDLSAQVFLIGDGSHWAYVGASEGVSQKGFPPLAELMDTFIELGGQISICSSCDGVCSLPGRDGEGQRRRREIQPRGLASVLAHLVGGNSLTF